MSNLPDNQEKPVEYETKKVNPPDDNEVVYYEGSPKVRGELGMLLVTSVITLALFGGAVAILIYRPETIPLWISPILVLLAVGVMTIPIIVTRRHRYRISNYRIDHEFGLLSKTINTLELWHVEDIKFYQSLPDRILRVGTITVFSGDKTNPQLPLRSLPNPRPIYDSLKQRVIAVKRQRGVLKLDMAGN